MTETKPTLPWGYNRGIPDGVTAAWGARGILERDGYVSFLGDRQGTFGDDEATAKLTAILNGPLKPLKTKPETTVYARARGEAKRLFDKRKFTPGSDTDLVLYEDKRIIVKGNPQSSYGYLYVAAWLK